MAAAADAIAVPPMPVKWTDLISDENMAGKFNRQDAKAQSFLLELVALVLCAPQTAPKVNDLWTPCPQRRKFKLMKQDRLNTKQARLYPQPSTNS
jgi:hypothetical protein